MLHLSCKKESQQETFVTSEFCAAPPFAMLPKEALTKTILSESGTQWPAAVCLPSENLNVLSVPAGREEARAAE